MKVFFNFCLIFVVIYVIDCRSSRDLEKDKSCRCGQSNSRKIVPFIVGGEKAEPHAHPWQIAIVDENDPKPHCGGTLISNQDILTAAHCGTTEWVVLGEHKVSERDGEERVKVCKTIPHPEYNERTVDKDFAILRLCNPVTFSDKVSPACLPSTSKNYDDVTAIVSGWGYTRSKGKVADTLMEVKVNTMTNAQCRDTNHNKNKITDNMICAGVKGKDSCQGDSGGPLVTADPKTGDYTVIGVEGYPGVYARVTSQLAWIQENMEGSNCS